MPVCDSAACVSRTGGVVDGGAIVLQKVLCVSCSGLDMAGLCHASLGAMRHAWSAEEKPFAVASIAGQVETADGHVFFFFFVSFFLSISHMNRLSVQLVSNTL